MPIDIAKVKECIKNNLKDIHTVEDVAAKLSVSSETLKKDFMRLERVGLSEYVTTLRVEKMKEKLLYTDEKCISICLDLGLREDAGARLFKKLAGITMEEFRQMHRNGHGQK